MSVYICGRNFAAAALPQQSSWDMIYTVAMHFFRMSWVDGDSISEHSEVIRISEPSIELKPPVILDLISYVTRIWHHRECLQMGPIGIVVALLASLCLRE